MQAFTLVHSGHVQSALGGDSQFNVGCMNFFICSLPWILNEFFVVTWHSKQRFKSSGYKIDVLKILSACTVRVARVMKEALVKCTFLE